MPLSDPQAKAFLLAWPTVTAIWTRPGENTRWLRAQPRVVGTTGPRLEVPGTGAFHTQPDGLWVTLGIAPSDVTTPARFADCVAVESCGTSQNLNDKRSRYGARTTSLMLKLPAAWLDASVTVQGGATRTRRQQLRGALPATGNVSLPIRHLRVLYALPNDGAPPSLYARVTAAMVMEAHEYVCPQSVLSNFNGPPHQKFLKRMAPELTRYP